MSVMEVEHLMGRLCNLQKGIVMIREERKTGLL